MILTIKHISISQGQMKKEILKIINQIPIADTHEHLLEEKDRLAGKNVPAPNDIGLLFCQYVDADLIAAGMASGDLKKITDPKIDPEQKWKIIRPWWQKIRFTGYGRMVRETVRILYGEEDLTDSNWKSVNDGIKSTLKPGFTRNILKDVCRIDHCQINALDEPVFRETEFPDLFLMDLCDTFISSDFELKIAANLFDDEIKSFSDCLAAIDRAYELYGKKAIAVKNQTAYRRKIDYEQWTPQQAEKTFNFSAEEEWKMPRETRKPLEDYLFHYSVNKAAEYGLPYKMHTGFLAGHSEMRLHHLRHNAGDMSELCRLHPDVNFVFMHANYPHQDETIALSKHYPNAYIDMCWSWMINPAASVRFLKEFLMAVPVNKIFMFGGDVSLVELVPGHLELAELGIAQAISELVQEGWLQIGDVGGILERLLWQNVYDLFDVKRLLKR